MSDKTDPRQTRAIKGLGVRMRYAPPKRFVGLQRWANPAPTNNPDSKAQEDTQSNDEQD